MDVDVRHEELPARDGDVVQDAHEADVAAATGGPHGLHHRLLGANGFQGAVDAEPSVAPHADEELSICLI